jgi:hypothetical protein
MRTLVLALICAFGSIVAFAKDGNECITAAGTLAPDFGLPHVAQAITRQKLDITVMGSASSELNGPGGKSIAYPTWLESALHTLLPGVAVKVVTHARTQDTAAQMEVKLKGILSEARPGLVVWQTGTADAIRGVEPEDFRMALDDGLERSQAAGADVILMNMQYSPRTEAMLAIGAYADTMLMIALQREVILFDRFSIMKRWNESGVFDLYAATRNTDIAQQVHDCLGRLLAKVVFAGAKMAVPAK